MKFRFSNNGIIIEGEFPSEINGRKYAEAHGYEIIYIEEIIEPEPMSQAEVEEMLLDQEYRILLLEYGLEDDEEVF